MKRVIGYSVTAVAMVSFCLWLGRLSAPNSGQAHAAATAGLGIPLTTNVTNSAGGSAIFLANPLRRFLFCQNIGATNAIYVTWGQTATATNGFLLSANGGTLTLPQGGCQSAGASNLPPGNGCVPTYAVNAIAAASGTNTLVCDED